MNPGGEVHQRPVLGIDLGTTYSCVADLDEYGEPVVLLNSDGSPPPPPSCTSRTQGMSSSATRPRASWLACPIGWSVRSSAAWGRRGTCGPSTTGLNNPAQVSSLILQYLVMYAFEYLGVEPTTDWTIADAVITVPVYFGAAEHEPRSRQVIWRVSTSSASSTSRPLRQIAHGMHAQDEARTVLVYDLGGGTFASPSSESPGTGSGRWLLAVIVNSAAWTGTGASWNFSSTASSPVVGTRGTITR